MKIQKESKYRAITMLTEKEKESIQEIAWYSGRSMSGFIRYLIIQELSKYEDEDEEY